MIATTEERLRKLSEEFGQTPRVHLAGGSFVKSYGELAIKFAAAHGLVLDEWQKLIVRNTLALSGKVWCYKAVGVSVPRQNGKTAAIEAIELFCLCVLGERMIHTSHQVKTTESAFDRLVGFFRNPEFSDITQQVKRIITAPGKQRIQLVNGGDISFISRESNSGRGFTVDRIIFDEAMHIDEASVSSLIPTASSGKKKNSQFLYFGTPPSAKHNGEQFRRIREQAFNKQPGVLWLEWSAETEGLNPDDELTWATTNPAIASGRYQIDGIPSARTQFADDDFIREILGVWGTAAANTIVDLHSWARCKDTSSKIESRRVLSLDVSPDRAWASVSVAGLRADGLPHIELLKTEQGTGWVVPYLVELFDKWESKVPGYFTGIVLDGKSPAAALIPELRLAKIRVTELDFSDVIVAAQSFYDAVVVGKVKHLEQQNLTNALSMSRRRTFTERGWGITRASQDANVTPIISAVFAFHGVMNKQKILRPVPVPVAEKKPAARGGFFGM